MSKCVEPVRFVVDKHFGCVNFRLFKNCYVHFFFKDGVSVLDVLGDFYVLDRCNEFVRLTLACYVGF